MLEVMQFIFSSFWIWLGTVILVMAAGDAVHGIIRITHKYVEKPKSL